MGAKTFCIHRNQWDDGNLCGFCKLFCWLYIKRVLTLDYILGDICGLISVVLRI